MTGKRVGKWLVLSRQGNNTVGNSAAMWLCRCDCGNESVQAGINLRQGKTKSCGCSLKGRQLNRLGRYSKEAHHAWKGGRSPDKKGYIKLSTSMVRELYPDAVMPYIIQKRSRQKPMYEHRAAMSHYLKRALHEDETIHHKNGDRSDNRIENLELRAGKHGPGQSIPDLVAWAKEILKRYDQT